MREPQLIIATGTKGVDKIFKTCQLVGKKPRKVLIFDANGEFRTKVLALKDEEKFNQNITLDDALRDDTDDYENDIPE